MTREQEQIVIAPGPVRVPVTLRDAVKPIHHRSDAFRSLVLDMEGMLRELIGTRSAVYALTASGTGAMEAAVVNTVRPGDRILVVSGGKFGDRWNEILSAYGGRARLLSFEPGTAVDMEVVAAVADQYDPDIVACTHVESSTGLLLDLHALASSLPRPLIMVDAIASLGAEELEMDTWGIDIVVSASQKAFASPPGVSFVALSDRARRRATVRPAYYLDLDRYESGRERGDTPFTPAIETIQMVHASMLRARETGWDSVRKRHKRMSDAFIDAMENLSLTSFPANPSAAVQAFRLPDGCDGAEFLGLLERGHGIIAASGQGHLKGSIFRTGFLGNFDGRTGLRIVGAIADTLDECGVNINVTEAERAMGAVSDLPGLY
jgi:aspartate aminotransferase-like enzyme